MSFSNCMYLYKLFQNKQSDSRALAYWMANSSELLHFLKSDRHMSAFSIEAQDTLAEGVHAAFTHLVRAMHNDLNHHMNTFMAEQLHDQEAAGAVSTEILNE